MTTSPSEKCQLCADGQKPHWDAYLGWAHVLPSLDEIDKTPCPEKTGKPAFACIFCEHQASIDYYRDKASAEECFRTLANWKTCTPCGQALGEIASKKEIERTVA